MFYGAISTDIKKSSSNWDMFPEWMKDWVENTNALTETVFERFPLEGHKEALILPNCPEGDAYTILYSHENKNTLREHLHKISSITIFPE